MPRIGKPGEPIAELTRFGWTMTYPWKEVDLTNMFLTQGSSCDYENLCRLDVLGLEDTNVGDQGIVYEEFKLKEQLKRSPEGWYEQVGLPWKGNYPPLLYNEAGSLKRLNALTKTLEKQAFLQVRIWEPDRGVMRFHWYKDLKTKEIEALRFTRALFGLVPSPFLLGGVLREHLELCRERFQQKWKKPSEVYTSTTSLLVDRPFERRST